MLERHLPDLTDLQLVDVSFAKIVLSRDLTPSLESLRMQNVPDECDLTLDLPSLKTVSIHFLGECDEVRRRRCSARNRLGWPCRLPSPLPPAVAPCPPLLHSLVSL